ncbi:MAG: hypothetical protein ACXVHB_31010 [Solirubrobacteraceae bacterium]
MLLLRGDCGRVEASLFDQAWYPPTSARAGAHDPHVRALGMLDPPR